MEPIEATNVEAVLAEDGEQRRRCDIIRGRLELLTGRDMIMMTMYYENGFSYRQIAALAKMSETMVKRRLEILSERLIDGDYIKFIRTQGRFSKEEMVIARDYFLLGFGLRKLARRHKYTYYSIRKVINAIRSKVKASNTRERK